MPIQKTIATFDLNISQKIHDYFGAFSVNPFVRLLRFVGDQKGYPIVLAFCLLSGFSLVEILMLTANVVFLTFLMMGLKLKIKRQRPKQKRENLHRFDQFSFPSGHAGRIGTILTYVVIFGIDLLPLFGAIVWGIVVCFQRIASGEHYLLDIIAGLFLGIVVASFPIFFICNFNVFCI